MTQGVALGYVISRFQRFGRAGDAGLGCRALGIWAGLKPAPTLSGLGALGRVAGGSGDSGFRRNDMKGWLTAGDNLLVCNGCGGGGSICSVIDG